MSIGVGFSLCLRSYMSGISILNCLCVYSVADAFARGWVKTAAQLQAEADTDTLE